jgi:TRAP-type mannitol/chloroaromatic compound transport system permease small subunit
VKKALLFYVNTIGRFNQLLGKGAGYIIWVIFGLLFYEAMSRSVLNIPHAWNNEISSYVFWAYIFLGGGYVLLYDGHVRMDAIYMRWSPRGRAIADAATFSFAAFYLVGMIWKTSFYAYLSIIQGEVQAAGIHSYVWPVRVIMVFGIIVVLLEAIAFFIKDMHLATKGKVLT